MLPPSLCTWTLAHLHLEPDAAPAGLVEFVGVEQERQDVVGVGAVLSQPLLFLFGVAGFQLGVNNQHRGEKGC